MELELHTAYRWLCGGVAVGYHTLSDFRSQRAAGLDTLITQVLALLLKQGLVDLGRVAQDERPVTLPGTKHTAGAMLTHRRCNAGTLGTLRLYE